MTDAEVATLREDLAAAFRITAQMGWSESVGNHFSAAVSADGKQFLLNRKWQHFASIRPEDLMLLDADDPDVMNRPDAPDASAWTIHGTVHRQCPAARVIIHCHPPHATALATLADPRMLPLDNNTARFFNRLAIDQGFGGIADEAEEGERLAAALGNKKTLLMGNHGVTCTGATVAEAFEDLYFFEKAAQTLLLAYASGQPLNVLSDEVAEKTARGWDDYRGMSYAHFDWLKSQLPALG
ncbi:class II aldolase/adducin family protein [Novosphingobium sp.]|uniref:class II aldolase/adducin family protein n=1 Tax=Novosphingobium sp. TaxID=1874826 RepID=UPI001D928A9A|nr:class II aldolase/adducin family protein [Novosphingobium sp.]MBX9665662.1 class II aldolase/adducin family protein [Novosphingobium sp.]